MIPRCEMSVHELRLMEQPKFFSWILKKPAKLFEVAFEKLKKMRNIYVHIYTFIP